MTLDTTRNIMFLNASRSKAPASQAWALRFRRLVRR